MSVVIDASVIIAVVVADERQDAARAHLEDWLEAGGTAVWTLDGALARNAADLGLPVQLVS